ncbi:RNA polymerase sigma factor [Paenibacillus silvae]|nr:RNA polymerase sigma factor [Paenibacillus silvae]
MDYSFLEEAQTIDNDTLASLMDDYGNDVWNYVYFLTRNMEQADDLSQEVFVRAYTGIANYRGDCSIKTWLLTITRNTTFTYRKSRFFRNSLWGETLSLESDPDRFELTSMLRERSAHPSAEMEVMRKAHVHEIWDIVLALPEKFREILLLHLRYELTTTEIADMLRISQGTAKSRLSRAKEKVRNQWKERS